VRLVRFHEMKCELPYLPKPDFSRSAERITRGDDGTAWNRPVLRRWEVVLSSHDAAQNRGQLAPEDFAWDSE
jgi:hypothetical protein